MVKKKAKTKPSCAYCSGDLTDYLWSNYPGEIQARNIRAPAKLWKRIEILKKYRGVKSVNHVVVAVLEFICDLEEIPHE